MKRLLLFIVCLNVAFAASMNTHVLITPLVFVAILMVLFIIWQKLKLKTKNQDLINILEREDSSVVFRDKTALTYDLQEVFLYFFKTLAYEASLNNNTFLVRQQMLVKDVDNNILASSNTHESSSSFYPPEAYKELKMDKLSSNNISQTNIDPNRELVRPVRHFFGDYTEVINGIYGSIDLLAAHCNNRTIGIDIEQLSGPDNQILLSVEIGICEPLNDEIIEIFDRISSPKDKASIERLAKYQVQINKIPGAKYYIKDNSSRISYAIAFSMPLVIADYNQPYKVAPNMILKALVVHENKDIASIIIQNLNDFNIECIYNQSAAGLSELTQDGVSFPYRAVIIDAALFSMLSVVEQDELMNARLDNCFELIIVLNNYKAANLIRADLASSLFFLPLPYTVDNMRAVVTALLNQHESLHN